ncbi:hypothetical protein LINPERPRIM_LOCUS25508, partial [Linum perenne]
GISNYKLGFPTTTPPLLPLFYLSLSFSHSKIIAVSFPLFLLSLTSSPSLDGQCHLLSIDLLVAAKLSRGASRQLRIASALRAPSPLFFEPPDHHCTSSPLDRLCLRAPSTASVSEPSTAAASSFSSITIFIVRFIIFVNRSTIVVVRSSITADRFTIVACSDGTSEYYDGTSVCYDSTCACYDVTSACMTIRVLMSESAELRRSRRGGEFKVL